MNANVVVLHGNGTARIGVVWFITWCSSSGCPCYARVKVVEATDVRYTLKQAMVEGFKDVEIQFDSLAIISKKNWWKKKL
ncbi:hypothetical protein ACH5RR_034200 [Cinchona calisaya]|uniref:RNase H type-1 domain-containing protein n=1 Tax=Cinchona calisaya TaxID=153742 RepID=A0ABD2YA78_9GENT